MAGEHVPPQDPTALTAIAVNALRQEVQRDMAALKELLGGGLKHLRELHDEKFASIETQFKERDTRTEQAAIGTKIAVDAALQAQKEAAAKMEAGFTKLMDQQADLMRTVTGAANNKIDELRARVDAIDGRSTATTETKTDSRGVIAMVIAVSAVAVSLIVPFLHR